MRLTDEEVIVKYDKANEVGAARMFKALGHPARAWIVKELVNGEHRVSDFVEAIGVEFATVSRHLAKLKSAKLVVSHKRGREIWYGLNKPEIARLTGDITAKD